MEITLILGFILCFLAGAGVALGADRAARGGSVRAFREKRQVSKEQARLRAILQNVEVYNGTASGQRELPGN